MKQALIATKPMVYGTRRLAAGAPFEASNPDARVLIALGKAKERDVKPKKQPPHNDLAFARAEYERVIGKRPFMGWNADELRAKIAAAKG
jgi:hypothetical protein